LLFWQRDPSVGNLSDWEANYGTIFTAPLAAASTAVPEPSSVLTCIMGVVLALQVRQNRSCDNLHSVVIRPRC
jgi:hypothetical protein